MPWAAKLFIETELGLSKDGRSPEWITDLAIPISSPARDEIFSTVNGVSLYTAFHNHPHIIQI